MGFPVCGADSLVGARGWFVLGPKMALRSMEYIGGFEVAEICALEITEVMLPFPLSSGMEFYGCAALL